MGLILDLAVVVLAGTVIVSLALLAWTLAVSSVRATHHGRERIASTRREVAATEERLRAGATLASATLAELANRTTPRGDRSDR